MLAKTHLGDCGSQVSIHIAFSPDGRDISVGCGNVVSVWKTLQRTGEPIFKYDSGATISSMVYSNSGHQLSAGLCTGEVDVFESDSGRLFTLGKPSTHSEVTIHLLCTMCISMAINCTHNPCRLFFVLIYTFISGGTFLSDYDDLLSG